MHRSGCRPVKRYGVTRERVQHDAKAPHVNRCSGVRRWGGEQQLWRGAVLRTGALRERARERRGARKVGENGLPGGAGDVNVLEFEVYAEALGLFGGERGEGSTRCGAPRRACGEAIESGRAVARAGVSCAL